MNGHGFFWFYFVNEHFLRFLGRRYPMDYNKLPGYLYWTLHLVWLFPWSLFVPLCFMDANRRWKRYGLIHPDRLYYSTPWILCAFFLATVAVFGTGRGFAGALPVACLVAWIAWRNRRLGPWYARNPEPLADLTQTQRTSLPLTIYSFTVLAFFSLSTNQEYYTFPAYLPLLMLLAAALSRAESNYTGRDPEARSARRWITFAHAAFATLGVLIAAALTYGLWSGRNLAAVPNVGDHPLPLSASAAPPSPCRASSTSPAPVSPRCACPPHSPLPPSPSGRPAPGSSVLAASTSPPPPPSRSPRPCSSSPPTSPSSASRRCSPRRTSPRASSNSSRITPGAISRDNNALYYGGQAYGSSIPFYLDRPTARCHPALLVDGRSLLHALRAGPSPTRGAIFLTPAELRCPVRHRPAQAPRFVPLAGRDDVDRLLGSRQDPPRRDLRQSPNAAIAPLDK